MGRRQGVEVWVAGDVALLLLGVGVIVWAIAGLFKLITGRGREMRTREGVCLIVVAYVVAQATIGGGFR